MSAHQPRWCSSLHNACCRYFRRKRLEALHWLCARIPRRLPAARCRRTSDAHLSSSVRISNSRTAMSGTRSSRSSRAERAFPPGDCRWRKCPAEAVHLGATGLDREQRSRRGRCRSAPSSGPGASSTVILAVGADRGCCAARSRRGLYQAAGPEEARARPPHTTWLGEGVTCRGLTVLTA